MAVVGALAGLHGATHAAQTTVAPDVDVLARYQFEPGTGESASEGFVTREGILGAGNLVYGIEYQHSNGPR